jgi:DEAD/DEAH box helicase domain-containing protein
VYDGYPGGAGFAERGYEAAAIWLTATREAIAACACETGCPSCVQSPKCGNGNEPLDKAGAIRLLDTLLAGAPPANAQFDAPPTDAPPTDAPPTDAPPTDEPASDEPASDEPASDEPHVVITLAQPEPVR